MDNDNSDIEICEEYNSEINCIFLRKLRKITVNLR